MLTALAPPPRPALRLSRGLISAILAITGINLGLVALAGHLADYPALAWGASVAAGLLAVGLAVNVRSARGVGKHVTIAAVFAVTTAVVFAFEIAPTPGYAYLPSLIAGATMYHELRMRVFTGVVHAACITLGYLYVPEAGTPVPLLPLVCIAGCLTSTGLLAVFDVSANRRHYARTRRMEALQLENEAALLRENELIERQNEGLGRARAEYERQLADNRAQLATLRRVNEDRGRLAGAASSDLKEPLRNISTFIHLIGRRVDALGLREGLDEYLGFVTDGARRMNAMVDDLLRYSDYQLSAEPEPVDAGEVVEAIRDNLRDLLAREGAAIEVAAELPVVPGQRTQVLQLFQNLISNGIKFRRAGVRPTCTVSAAVADGVATFAVADNGIGMPANRLADVFGLFTRLHAREGYEGTGIGLALCRRIVLEAGGEIWATSTEGVGTTFHFTWPLEAAAVPA